MKMMTCARLFFITLLSLCLAGAAMAATVQDPSRERLEAALGPQLLKGDVWQRMDQDCKVAFVWGFGQVVIIENELAKEFPQLKTDNFTGKVSEGMPSMSINTVVQRIDDYYKSHPGDLDKPVLAVIWEVMVKPNLKTGVAGRPLQK